MFFFIVCSPGKRSTDVHSTSNKKATATMTNATLIELQVEVLPGSSSQPTSTHNGRLQTHRLSLKSSCTVRQLLCQVAQLVDIQPRDQNWSVVGGDTAVPQSSSSSSSLLSVLVDQLNSERHHHLMSDGRIRRRSKGGGGNKGSDRSSSLFKIGLLPGVVYRLRVSG